MVKGPHTSWCQVSDMDRSVAFYRDILGLTAGVVSPYWSDFTVGAIKIGLHPRMDGGSGSLATDGRGWYLGLETDDIRAMKDKVEGSTGSVLGGYHDTPSGVVLTILDPDGNQLQLLQAGAKAADLSP